jgi:class 3 adenylate cyclase
VKLTRADLLAMAAAGVTEYRETADGVTVVFGGPVREKPARAGAKIAAAAPIAAGPADAMLTTPPAPELPADTLEMLAGNHLPGLAPEGGPS